MGVESKFKVGDRVRYRDEYASGEGVIHSAANEKTYGSGFVWLVTVAEADKDYAYFIDKTCRAFREADLSLAPLTIQAGRYYKTRDGRKVGPMEPYNGGWTQQDCGRMWKSNGERFYGDVDGSEIVALWEEPAAPVAVAASNDNAATPKFKVGDWVKHPNNSWLRFYQVKKIEGGKFWIEALGCFFHHAYTVDACDWIVRPADAPSTPAIVALIKDGTPAPSATPKVHPDQATASKEAERLALAYPDQEFGVFVLADRKIAEIVTETVLTRRLRAA